MWKPEELANKNKTRVDDETASVAADDDHALEDDYTMEDDCLLMSAGYEWEVVEEMTIEEWNASVLAEEANETSGMRIMGPSSPTRSRPWQTSSLW